MLAALVALNTIIVSPAWVAEHQARQHVVLLHVGDKADYDAAHIPGAQFITLKDISDPDAKLTLQMASPERLRAAFEERGIGDASTVVVSFGADWVTPAARVFVALDYLGLGSRSYILDGGVAAWRAEGRPVTSDVKPVARGTLAVRPRPDVIADAVWVQAHLRDSGVAIVDARATEFYTGANPGRFARGGHIAGASSVPFSTLVNDTLTFKDEPSLRALFNAAGVKTGSDIVTYCHIGQQASAVYVAARALGYKVRLYDGSFEEWSSRPELPVEPAPGPRR